MSSFCRGTKVRQLTVTYVGDLDAKTRAKSSAAGGVKRFVRARENFDRASGLTATLTKKVSKSGRGGVEAPLHTTIKPHERGRGRTAQYL